MVKRSAGELLFAISRRPRVGASPITGAGLRRRSSSSSSTGDSRPASGCRRAARIARELDISRTTAIAVFERLMSEGLIVSRTGSGSFVSDVAEAQKPRAAARRRRRAAGRRRSSPTSSPRPRRASSSGSPHPQKPRAFVTGLPAFDAFPLARLVAAVGQALARSRATSSWAIPIRTGCPPLRQAIAEHLRRQSRHRLRRRADLHRQRRAAGVRPDRPRAGQSAAIRSGSRIRARSARATASSPAARAWCRAGRRAKGFRVEAGLRLAPRFPAGLRHALAPASDRRRDEPANAAPHLLRAANERDAWIVEDDYDGEFSLRRRGRCRR